MIDEVTLAKILERYAWTAEWVELHPVTVDAGSIALLAAAAREREQLRWELAQALEAVSGANRISMDLDSERREVLRERDEARDQRDGLMAQVELLAHERDEARKQVIELKTIIGYRDSLIDSIRRQRNELNTALDMQRQATEAAQVRAEEAWRELAAAAEKAEFDQRERQRNHASILQLTEQIRSLQHQSCQWCGPMAPGMKHGSDCPRRG